MPTFFEKYDVPAPRYTSYPTVPYWEGTPTSDFWMNSVRKDLQSNLSWGLYLHLPFCETLCRYCGCTNIITKDHNKEEAYVQALLREWSLYLQHVPELKTSPLRQIHLGGGTPTFFSPKHLRFLIESILQSSQHLMDNFEGSVEVDPRRTTREHLETLYGLGFRRISLGVQDLDEKVQTAIHRKQPIEQVEHITALAREIGFTSVNYDLIYGLPMQTLESVTRTVEVVSQLNPDRIALYSFAFVPWLKPHHKVLEKQYEIPSGADKRHLYEQSRSLLIDQGYVEIGMDHFARPDESLAVALKQQRLHRNFMGYTDVRSEVMIGLGISAISESSGCFVQNTKDLNEYYQKLSENILPMERGHMMTDRDRLRRTQILNLMTKYSTEFLTPEEGQDAADSLNEMVKDGLVKIQENRIQVTDEGRPFLRNVCMFFDERLRARQPSAQQFSKSV